MNAKTLTSTLVLTFLMTAPAAMAMGDEDQKTPATPKSISVKMEEPSTPTGPSWLNRWTWGLLGSPGSPSSQIDESRRFTFRTTQANPNAQFPRSAISIKLPNRALQAEVYTLLINHRTLKEGTEIKIHNAKTRKYMPLGHLSIFSGFSDEAFDLSSFVKEVRYESSNNTVVPTYLSFENGSSDIHSFTILSGEEIVKKVVLGNQESEAQSGITVYGPETQGDSNEWSVVKQEDAK